MNLYFLIPGDINSLTGGYLYNKRMAEGLRQKGHDVHIISLPESYLDIDLVERKCRFEFNRMHPNATVVIDSLILGSLYRVVNEFKDRFRTIGMIHLPVTYDPLNGTGEKILAPSELQAFTFVHHLIVTGRFMVNILVTAGMERNKISVVEPGVDNFPRKQHYALVPSELLCISNYSALKGQLILLSALGKLLNRNWTLRLYGDLSKGKNYVRDLRTFVTRKNLTDRICICDSLQRQEITKSFLNSDLFVLPSLFESYGMVLTEALAHGIPVVTSMAGNIPATVPENMGIFTEPGNVDNLAAVLDELFTDPIKYSSLCRAAANYYRQSRSWESTIDEFETIIRDK